MSRPSRVVLPLTAAAVVLALGAAPAVAAVAPDGGAIARHYAELGGASGPLGPAISPDLPTPVRPGAYQLFSTGSIYWSATTGAWDVHGLIRDDWATLGYENSVLGFPTGDETAIGPVGSGEVYQTFEAGLAYYSPAVGAHEVHGAILAEYAALGFEHSQLGFPTSNELASPDGQGRYETFEFGSIYWSPITGAHEIQGAIRDKWTAIGAEQSLLGYPTTDEYAVPGGRQSDFPLGSITWTPSTGALVTSFFGPVSSVRRARSVFSVGLLAQDFTYDDNDTFLRLPLATGSTGTLPQPTTLTKRQFTNDLGVDTFIVAKNWSPDPRTQTTFEILDIANLPKTAQARAALLRALP